MKSVLIIGMGQYGNHLCKKMYELGNEIMIVDKEESQLSECLSLSTAAQVGDCTKREVIQSLGVDNFDVCFVCMADDFENSLVITSLVKEFGAKMVVSEASKKMQVRFLLNNGADEVAYPVRDNAERIGVKYGTNLVLDYIELADGYSMYEINPLKNWIGKSIRQIDVRAKYNITIIAIKEDDKCNFTPDIDKILEKDTTLMIVGNESDIQKLLTK